jgi:hypothetical protein
VMTGALQGAYEDLIHCLRHGGKTRSDARDARDTVAIIDGILVSNAQGGCLVDVR